MKDYTNCEIWDYEGDRVIKVNKFSKMHNAYDCTVFEIIYTADGEEKSDIGSPALLTQNDLDRIHE